MSLVLPNANITLINSAGLNIGGSISAHNILFSGTTTISAGAISANLLLLTGDNQLNAGSLTLNALDGSGSVTITGANASIYSYVFAGDFNLRSSTLESNAIIGDGNINITDSSVRVVQITGADYTLSNSSMQMGNGNFSGPFTLSNSSLIAQQFSYSGQSFLVNGSVQIGTGYLSGTTTISGGSFLAQNLTSSGSIDIDDGTIEITGRWMNFGVIDVSGGTLIVPSSVQISGSFHVISSAAANHPDLPATLAHIPYAGGYKIMYTWYGDANGDGVVNGDDLALIAPVGTTKANWADGDFNGNGVIDTDDFALFALGAAQGSENILTAIPEPLTSMFLPAFVVMSMSRRRGY